MYPIDLSGKNAIVFGVANDHSIAWAIAQALQREGAELAFTYVGEAIEKRVRPLAESIGVRLVLPCDVAKDDEIAATFAALREQWGRVDVVIHAVAFALRDELKGRFCDTSRAGFHLALDVSTYSLIAMARYAEPLMPAGGALLTLTYFGAEKVLPNYNVMGIAKAALEHSVRYLAYDLGPRGIRANAIAPGMIETPMTVSLPAEIRAQAERESALGRLGHPRDVAAAVLFLASPLAAHITGHVLIVDGGQLA